jgi:hypothetical protein
LRPSCSISGAEHRIGFGLLQFVKQRVGLPEVRHIETLSEPAVDGCEEIMGFVAPVVIAPKLRKAHGGAQLERSGLLAARDG